MVVNIGPLLHEKVDRIIRLPRRAALFLALPDGAPSAIASRARWLTYRYNRRGSRASVTLRVLPAGATTAGVGLQTQFHDLAARCARMMQRHSRQIKRGRRAI